MQRMPLGEYELFKKWSGHPLTWGAGGEGRVWFGGKVLDGLCTVLDEHLAATGGRSAAIGCVPWLTHDAVTDRLEKLNSLCVVVDKALKSKRAIARLMTEVDDDDVPMNGFPNTAIGRLSDLLPSHDGEPVVVGPYTPREVIEHVIDPVRRVGWLHEAKDNPIVHAKMLVMGRIDWVDYGHPDYGEDMRAEFRPMTVWLGSANWTGGSMNHLEFGIASRDAELVAAATNFVADVIAFSEPLNSQCASPEPNMLSYDIDEAAMWEASEEQRLAHLEHEAELDEEDE